MGQFLRSAARRAVRTVAVGTVTTAAVATTAKVATDVAKTVVVKKTAEAAVKTAVAVKKAADVAKAAAAVQAAKKATAAQVAKKAAAVKKVVATQVAQARAVAKVVKTIADIKYPLVGYKAPKLEFGNFATEVENLSVAIQNLFEPKEAWVNEAEDVVNALANIFDDVKLEAKDVVLFSNNLNGLYSPFATAKAGEWVYVQSCALSFDPFYEAFVDKGSTEAKKMTDWFPALVAKFNEALKDDDSEFFRLPEELSTKLFNGIKLYKVRPAINGIPAVYKFKMPARLVSAYDFNKTDIDTAVIINGTGAKLNVSLTEVNSDTDFTVNLPVNGFKVMNFDTKWEKLKFADEEEVLTLVNLEKGSDISGIIGLPAFWNAPRVQKALNFIGNICDDYIHINVYVICNKTTD